MENLVSIINDRKGLDLLVNNAAIQIVKPVEQLLSSDFQKSLLINVIAPFVLIRELLEEIIRVDGSVVNIGSIHAELTKATFTAYSVSKNALRGLTKSLSLELGDRVRINSIEPAAISTEMLVAGFNGDNSAIAMLKDCHPTKTIGSPQDVVNAIKFLSNSSNTFLNGCILGLDGGIRNRLFDPQ